MIAYFLIEDICTGYSNINMNAIYGLNPIGSFKVDTEITRRRHFTISDIILVLNLKR